MEFKKKIVPFLEIIFLSLLTIYPFRHVCLGVDLMDGGYSYANFVFSGEEYMDSMWFFATWFANIFGSILTHLPGGNTMLGMNVYTTLLISAMAVATYLFCTKKLHLRSWIVFVGEMVAISLCWVPTSALYNYLTYALLLFGTMFLLEGLKKDKGHYLIFAGICLGFNVAVRFSNLPQMGLILVVWYYAYINKKKINKVFKETGFCMLGYAGALSFFLLIISIKYGFGEYAEGIRRLFAMTEYATDYSAGSMLKGMIGGYLEIGYWVKRCMLAGGISFMVCLAFPKKWKRVKQIITIIVMLLLFWWFRKSGFYSFDNKSYYAIYYPCILVLLMAMGLSMYQMLDKSASKDVKLQSISLLVLILITSLGSNNAIFSTINNLFFVMPGFLAMAYVFIKEKKQVLLFPFQTILAMGVLLVLLQSAKYGYYYVYEEADGARDLSTKITQVPVLNGMYTSEKKARELENLYAYLQDNELYTRECILFGDIPGVSYYTGLAPAMNTWSDLRSYSPETMQVDLQEIEEDIMAGEDYPLVIIHEKYADYYKNRDAAMLPEEITIKIKLDYICDFMDKYEYSLQYVDGTFTVFGR